MSFVNHISFANAAQKQDALLGVSVVMPVYNTVGDQLIEAVSSVYGQHVQGGQFEIIVINDGSTHPDTLEALSEIKSWPNVRMITQENKGQSAARNIGLRSARFKYIACLDSDDYFNSDPAFVAKHGSYLNNAMARLERSDDLAVVIAKHASFIAGESNVRPIVFPTDEKGILAHGMPIFGVYRQDDALSFGGYEEDVDCIEDWHFWVGLLNERLKQGKKRKVYQISETHYFYRDHEHGQNVNARERDWSFHFKIMTQRNPEILLENFPHIALKDMPSHLESLKTSYVDKLNSRLHLALRDPVWGVSRILPFLGNRLAYAMHRAGFKVKNDYVDLKMNLVALEEKPQPVDEVTALDVSGNRIALD